MLRFVWDQDFNGRIVRGLLRRKPGIDLLRAQDAGLSAASDSAILAWAAEFGRIVLTHDVSTLIPCAHDRVRAGQPMPGVIAIPQLAPIGVVVEDLLLIVQSGTRDDFEGQVVFLPF